MSNININKKLTHWYAVMQKKNPTTEFVVEVVNTGKGPFESCYGSAIKPGERGYQLTSVVAKCNQLVRVSDMPLEAPTDTLESIELTEVTPSISDAIEPVQSPVETSTKKQVQELMSESKPSSTEKPELVVKVKEEPTPTKKPRRKGGRPKGSKNKVKTESKQNQ